MDKLKDEEYNISEVMIISNIEKELILWQKH